MDLVEIISDFSNHESCLKYLEEVRWKGTPRCPYCGSSVSFSKRNRYTCGQCNRSFSVTVGTIFESSRLSLTKWFLGISIILSAKKGVSSRQLARHLSVDKDTAWLLQKKVRQAMAEKDVLLNGIIEADESFIGGRRGNKYRAKREDDELQLGTGYQGKAPVLGMLERSGKVITKVLNKAWGKEIIPQMKQWISPSSTIVTDGFGGYVACSEHFEAHYVLNHGKEIHRIGDFHMNSIEGFWGMFKRALAGQYHTISVDYLQSYFDELAFKYNYRKSKDKGFNVLINNMLNL